MYTTNTKFSKTRYFYGRQSNTATNVFTELDRAAHSAEKRLISHAFSRKNLLGMQDMINANTQRWVEQLRSRAREGGWIALWDATRCLTLDTISTFSYGSPEGGLDQPDFKHEVFDVFNAIPIFAPAVQCLPLVPTLFKIIATVYPGFIDSRSNEVSLWGLLSHPALCVVIIIISAECQYNDLARVTDKIWISTGCRQGHGAVDETEEKRQGNRWLGDV